MMVVSCLRLYVFFPKVHRALVGVPLYHCFGSVVGGISLAFHGSTCVLATEGYNPKVIMETMEKERLVFIFLQKNYVSYLLHCAFLQVHNIVWHTHYVC